MSHEVTVSLVSNNQSHVFAVHYRHSAECIDCLRQQGRLQSSCIDEHADQSLLWSYMPYLSWCCGSQCLSVAKNIEFVGHFFMIHVRAQLELASVLWIWELIIEQTLSFIIITILLKSLIHTLFSPRKWFLLPVECRQETKKSLCSRQKVCIKHNREEQWYWVNLYR